MLRGYRGIVAALGLILTGAQQPPEQPQAKAGAQQAQASPKAAPAPTPASQPTYRPYAQRYADACYNAQDHDAADLCAQWRAALAAEKAAHEARLATIAAIIGTVLSLATVIGLTVTIWQTHGALGEARRGNRINLIFEKRARREARESASDQKLALEIASRNADAAAAHVAIAQDSARRQIRAYVWFRVKPGSRIIPNEKPMINTTIFNGRKTAAYKLRGQSRFAITEPHAPMRDFPVTGPVPDQILPPNEEHPSPGDSDVALPQHLFDAVIAGKLILRAEMRVDYADCFGESHTTIFPFTYNPIAKDFDLEWQGMALT